MTSKTVAAQSIQQQIKEAKEQLKALQSKETKFTKEDLKLTVKIGEKGSINIYGLNKQYPVCLYLSQAIKVEKLLASPEFKQFITENQAKLTVKQEKKEE